MTMKNQLTSKEKKFLMKAFFSPNNSGEETIPFAPHYWFSLGSVVTKKNIYTIYDPEEVKVILKQLNTKGYIIEDDQHNYAFTNFKTVKEIKSQLPKIVPFLQKSFSVIKEHFLVIAIFLLSILATSILEAYITKKITENNSQDQAILDIANSLKKISESPSLPTSLAKPCVGIK